jgi:hypothetical protein
MEEATGLLEAWVLSVFCRAIVLVLFRHFRLNISTKHANLQLLLSRILLLLSTCTVSPLLVVRRLPSACRSVVGCRLLLHFFLPVHTILLFHL